VLEATLMRDDLRVANLIPLLSPYAALGFHRVGLAVEHHICCISSDWE
jgi:hypothetical protein